MHVVAWESKCQGGERALPGPWDHQGLGLEASREAPNTDLMGTRFLNLRVREHSPGQLFGCLVASFFLLTYNILDYFSLRADRFGIMKGCFGVVGS